MFDYWRVYTPIPLVMDQHKKSDLGHLGSALRRFLTVTECHSLFPGPQIHMRNPHVSLKHIETLPEEWGYTPVSGINPKFA